MNSQLNALRERRAELATRLAASRAAIVEVTRALSLVDRAAGNIDALLARIDNAPTRPDDPRFSSRGPEAVGPDIVSERDRRRALHRLRDDLTAIRRHWEKRRAALGSG